MTIKASFLYNKLPDLKGTPFRYETRIDMTEEGQPGIVLALLHDGTKIYETGFELYTLLLVHAYCNDELNKDSIYEVTSLDGFESEEQSGEDLISTLDETFDRISASIKNIAAILDNTGIVNKPRYAEGGIEPQEFDAQRMETIRRRLNDFT